MKTFPFTSIQEFAPGTPFPKDLAGLKLTACPQGKRVLADLSILEFYGAGLWLGYDGATLVSAHCSKFGKRKKNSWEPYQNWYLSYTLPGYRRQGAASTLGLLVRSQAVAAGCVRMKSLCGTWLGLTLHASLGDQFWGITSKGEVQVDTPIVSPPLGRFPSGVTPPNGRKWTTRTFPYTLQEIHQITNGVLAYELPRNTTPDFTLL